MSSTIVLQAADAHITCPTEFLGGDLSVYIVHLLYMMKECMALYGSKFLKVYNFSLSCK